MINIGEKTWINRLVISEILEFVIEKGTDTVSVIDPKDAEEIRQLQECLEEEHEVTVKVPVEQDNGETMMIPKTVMVKLKDCTEEFPGSPELLKDKSQIEERIAELEATETEEPREYEKEIPGYTIIMRNDNKYEITDQKYMDIVRDQILTK